MGSGEIKSQREYRETPYEDQSWEVLGERNPQESFLPMEVQFLRVETAREDPMFVDFGGKIDSSAKMFRHKSPEEAAREAANERSETSGPPKISILPEELEALKREAYAAGEAAVRAELEAAHQQQLQALQQGITGVLQDMAGQVAQHVELLERGAVELALDISKKIVGHAVEINPEYVGQVVREALDKVGSARIRRVRVSPEDLEFIEIVGINQYLKEQSREWQFEGDATVKSGCIVDTTAGQIDYQLDQAWERMKDNIVKVVR